MIVTWHTSFKLAGSVSGDHPWWVRQASSKGMMATRSLVVLVGFHQSGDSVLRSGLPTMTTVVRDVYQSLNSIRIHSVFESQIKISSLFSLSKDRQCIPVQ